MVVGFVLIDCAPSHRQEVYNKLREEKEITELHHILEEHDLIAKIEADSLDAIKEIVLKKIRRVSGVVSTKTLMEAKF